MVEAEELAKATEDTYFNIRYINLRTKVPNSTQVTLQELRQYNNFAEIQKTFNVPKPAIEIEMLDNEELEENPNHQVMEIIAKRVELRKNNPNINLNRESSQSQEESKKRTRENDTIDNYSIESTDILITILYHDETNTITRIERDGTIHTITIETTLGNKFANWKKCLNTYKKKNRCTQTNKQTPTVDQTETLLASLKINEEFPNTAIIINETSKEITLEDIKEITTNIEVASYIDIRTNNEIDWKGNNFARIICKNIEALSKLTERITQISDWRIFILDSVYPVPIQAWIELNESQGNRETEELIYNTLSQEEIIPVNISVIKSNKIRIIVQKLDDLQKIRNKIITIKKGNQEYEYVITTTNQLPKPPGTLMTILDKKYRGNGNEETIIEDILKLDNVTKAWNEKDRIFITTKNITVAKEFIKKPPQKFKLGWQWFGIPRNEEGSKGIGKTFTKVVNTANEEISKMYNKLEEISNRQQAMEEKFLQIHISNTKELSFMRKLITQQKVIETLKDQKEELEEELQDEEINEDRKKEVKKEIKTVQDRIKKTRKSLYELSDRIAISQIEEVPLKALPTGRGIQYLEEM